MVVLRRFVLIMALLFWQGGFMFYASVVVTVGANTLGSELLQGFITESVTNYLNVAGAFCITVWGMSLWCDPRSTSGRIRSDWLLWSTLLATLGVLLQLHPRMDQCLDFESRIVLNMQRFHSLHRIYLITSTAQWLISCILLWLTLARWIGIENGPDHHRNS